VKYETKVLEIGSNAKDMLQTGLLILFNNSAPKDLKPYCLITQENRHEGKVKPGDTLAINKQDYIITAIGENANENLYDLGHVSLCFDGSETAKLPGHMHLTPYLSNDLMSIETIKIF